MRDLTEALDLRSGSIYHAFGGKDGLYEAALDAYSERDLELLARCRSEVGPGLAGFYAFMREVTSSGDTPRACFLVRTMLEANAALADRARALQGTFVAPLHAMLAEEVEAGRLSETADRTALLQFLVVQLTGIRTFADGPADAATVSATVDLVVAAIEWQLTAAS